MKILKRIASMIMVLVMIVPMFSGCASKKKEAVANEPVYMTRAEWVTMLGRTFGMDDPVESECAYTDVEEGTELYNYVQACYEWGVLSTGTDKFKPNDIATVGFVVTSAVLASEVDYTKYAIGDNEQENIINCADQTGICAGITYDEKVLSQGIEELYAALILNSAQGLYLASHGEEKYEVSYVDSVVDLSTMQEPVNYTDADTVKLDEAFASNLQVGEIVVLPASKEYPGGHAIKIEALTPNADGTYSIDTSEPELYELYDEFDVISNVEATPEMFIPADGVEIVETPDVNQSAVKIPSSDFSTLENTASGEAIETAKVGFDGKNTVTLKVSIADNKLSFSSDASTDVESVVEVFGIGIGSGIETNLDGPSIDYEDKEKINNVFDNYGIKSLGKNSSSDIDDLLEKYKKDEIDYDELQKGLEPFKNKTNKGKLTVKTVEAKFEAGYSITGEVKIETEIDVSCKLDFGFFSVDIDKYSADISNKITTELTVEGEVGGSVALGMYKIPIGATGVTVTAEVSLYCELNGSITVKTELLTEESINYSKGKTKKTHTTEKSGSVEFGVSLEAGIGLRVAIGALGIDIVDVQFTIGILFEATVSASEITEVEVTDELGKSSINIKKKIKIEPTVGAYFPIVKLSVGTEKCLVEKLGLSKTWELVSKEDAIKIFERKVDNVEVTIYDITVSAELLPEETTEEPTTDEIATDETTSTEEPTTTAPDEFVTPDSDVSGAVINLSDIAVEISQGGTYTIKVVSLPAGYTTSDLVWSSDEINSVAVANNGMIIGVAEGSAEITVKTSDGKYSAACFVMVK